MKKILFVLLTVIATVSCKKEESHAALGTDAEMAFTETEYDFGDIKQGDVVTHVFPFKNAGGSELVISNAVGSCGCTVPEFPVKPIAPGETADIKVKFNSAGKSGLQTKTVTLTTNTKNGREMLTIKASITPTAG